jgi:ParB family chromosome partitioning protein
MAKKVNKKELGLGIRALLGNIEEEYKENASGVIKDLNSGVLEIPLEHIETNPFQPRSEFEQQSIQELATSINTYGLIQPITVRRLNAEKYQLISGERRYRASQLAGLEQIPAYIRLADDQQMLEMALVENIQRKDLNAIEVAISYQRLIDECQLTHEGLSERIGKDRTTVTNYTRLLKLPPEIQQAIKSNSISTGHAKALAGIQDIALQLALLRKTIDEELSVRALEQLIRSYNLSKNKREAPEPRKSNKFKQIAFQLSDKYETDVQIKANPETDKGTIIIHFNGIDDFNRIFEQLDI